MVDEPTKEDVERIILKTLLDLIDSVKTLTEHSEKLAIAIEMLAEQQGYEFVIKDGDIPPS
jgi:hypothetical protein